MARILDMRPTQMAVGYREVERKRRRWREAASRGAQTQMIVQAVRGPGGRLYILDGHHQARALLEEGVEQVTVIVVADFSALSFAAFWRICSERGWGHAFDVAGERRPMWTMPPTIRELADDPHRSLASELRRAGGFEKTPAPHSEFLWADFLRTRIALETVRADFEGAAAAALSLASSPAAAHLPGWRSAVWVGAARSSSPVTARI